MSEGICMCFNKAILPRMFKHVASENGPLVLILQSYSQIFIVKHIDLNLVELIWTTKNCEISSVSGLVQILQTSKEVLWITKLYKYEKKKLPNMQFL